MKLRSIIVLLMVILVSITNAQTVIRMEKVNGVFVMPCTVNGLPLKFIFDTGAADVSVSLTEALFMLKNDYLSKDDLIGTTYYKLANGEIEEGTNIILRRLSIGKITLFDVKAGIVHNLDAPLLLGQTALKKLGKIQFDYSDNTLTILDGSRGNGYETSNNNYGSSNYGYNSNSSSYQSSGQSTVVTKSAPFNCKNPGEMAIRTGTLLYNSKKQSIIVAPRNTCAQIISRYNPEMPGYWYVEYSGLKGYIIAEAFSSEF